MKSYIPLLLAIMLLSCSEQPKEAVEKTPVKKYSIETLLNNKSIYMASYSHDESKILVGNNSTGIYNANMIDLETGEISPLTESTEESVWASSLFPNDDRLIYTADNGGNELDHVFLRNEDGSIEDLTPFEGAKCYFGGWTKDKTGFFFGSNQRDNRYMDMYVMNIERFESEMIYENTEGYDFAGISDDMKFVALTKVVNSNDNDLFLMNRETEERIQINTNQSGNSPSGFSNDSKSMYYLTDDENEFSYLMKYDLETGEKEKVMEEPWDIAYSYFSENEKYQVVGINNDGRTQVKLFDVASGAQMEFPDLEGADVSSVSISKSENQMIISAGSSNSPTNLFHYSLETNELKQLTSTLNPEIDQDDLVAAEVARYKSFDDLDIPAIYYKPKDASVNNKVPALVWVHGGPGGQSRANYSPLIQYLVNHGYAVLAVNNRGSSGYGKTFFNMDNQNHGEADLRDCIEGKNYLASLPYIDTDKIGIIGGSYGGFMTMRAMTHTPDEFKVGVNLFGVTNWLRTMKNIPPWWESFREALYLEMGDPNTEDSVRLYEISPVFHGDQVTNPVMVLQGATDPRVLQVESDEMVEAIRANGVTVEYVLFDDEGHGFVKKENQIEGYSKILNFLDQYLKGESSGEDQPTES
ncbi:MAG: S9 family peptidase [Flavobacteriales bacterium]|nr:S9 family peptidase [Flavobacteriales bacterium]